MTGRVLLIEDNEANRYLATYLLEHDGFHVTHAPDGPSGIDRASRESFDIILIDIQLPGMDGYAVTAALRTNPALSGVPMVAVTSYAMHGDREKALAAGCTGYIEKPVNPLTFVSEVRGQLTGARMEPS